MNLCKQQKNCGKVLLSQHTNTDSCHIQKISEDTAIGTKGNHREPQGQSLPTNTSGRGRTIPGETGQPKILQERDFRLMIPQQGTHWGKMASWESFKVQTSVKQNTKTRLTFSKKKP